LTEQGSGKSRPPRKLPAPPHPTKRRQALPNQSPKPRVADADAPAAVRKIVANPNYRPADSDAEFLQRNDTRGVRLQLDYLKPETLLEEHGVAHTVVVFGSTRIPEPQAAQKALADYQSLLAVNPNDEELQRRVGVAQRVLAKARYYDVAREFGRLVGAAGPKTRGGRVMVMTGGGPGIMEAANRGAHDVGARSIGLNITLPLEQFPNPYITPELCFQFHYFAMRKLHFLLRARALVAFPGGYGTVDELFEVLTLAQTRKIRPVPVILVGEDYWRRVFDVDFLAAEGTIDHEDRELFWYAETAEEIWGDILRWYETIGEPLIDAPARP
jgi:uncharacterized protein (TIGR00730 family)